MVHSSRWTLDIITPCLDGCALTAIQLIVREGVSQKSCYTIKLLSKKKLKLSQLIGQRIALVYQSSDFSNCRYFSGIIKQLYVDLFSDQKSYFSYHCQAVDWFQCMDTNRKSRTFHNKSTLQIYEEICKKQNIKKNCYKKCFKDIIFPRHCYCVQYQESDYIFLRRLLINSGLYYFFESDKYQQKMLLFDSSQLQMNSDFIEFNETTLMSGSERLSIGFGVNQFLKIKTTDRTLSLSQIIKFKGLNYRIVKIMEIINNTCPESISDNDLTNVNNQYPHCKTIFAVPLGVLWVPPFAKKTLSSGVEYATVIGQCNDEINCDELARIKVAFHWHQKQTLGSPKQSWSTWVPVKQYWAGCDQGMLFLPAVNDKVVISYFDGDPNFPVIVGCVRNNHYQKNAWQSLASPQLNGFVVNSHQIIWSHLYNKQSFKIASVGEFIMNVDKNINTSLNRGSYSIINQKNYLVNVLNGQFRLDVMTSIRFQVNDHFIEITPQHIKLSGQVISLNSKIQS